MMPIDKLNRRAEADVLYDAVCKVQEEVASLRARLIHNHGSALSGVTIAAHGKMVKRAARKLITEVEKIENAQYARESITDNHAEMVALSGQIVGYCESLRETGMTDTVTFYENLTLSAVEDNDVERLRSVRDQVREAAAKSALLHVWIDDAKRGETS
jgi:hypothetical protein